MWIALSAAAYRLDSDVHSDTARFSKLRAEQTRSRIRRARASWNRTWEEEYSLDSLPALSPQAKQLCANVRYPNQLFTGDQLAVQWRELADWLKQDVGREIERAAQQALQDAPEKMSLLPYKFVLKKATAERAEGIYLVQTLEDLSNAFAEKGVNLGQLFIDSSSRTSE